MLCGTLSGDEYVNQLSGIFLQGVCRSNIVSHPCTHKTGKLKQPATAEHGSPLPNSRAEVTFEGRSERLISSSATTPK